MNDPPPRGSYELFTDATQMLSRLARTTSVEGLSICQLSDFHRSDIVPERHIRACAEAGQKLDCQLVALTGDFVSNNGKHYKSLAEALLLSASPR